jgi:DNA-binding NarL/FixJ family response regulator
VLNIKGCCCSCNHLTPREVDVTVLAAAGLSNSEIARRMKLSGHTVSTYVIDAMHRLGARNRTELVARCYANGLLDAGSWPPEATGRRCITQLRPVTHP